MDHHLFHREGYFAEAAELGQLHAVVSVMGLHVLFSHILVAEGAQLDPASLHNRRWLIHRLGV